MAHSELTLVLSGYLCSPQSFDLRPFWRGFIELQKRLPTENLVGQIVAHSWNPDLAGLAHAAYAPQVERHEHQVGFSLEFLQHIESPDNYERRVDHLGLFWDDRSIESVLGDASSRARAVQLMGQLPTRGGQVLITRWDLGQIGSTPTNHLVANAALPDDYIYLTYSSEVDEGYADTWVQAPWDLALHFGHFDTFVLNALAGRNRYLESFTKTGWPRARIRRPHERVLSHPLCRKIQVTVSRIALALQGRSQGDNLFKRIVRKLASSVQLSLAQPQLTAENSCVPASEHTLPVFPESHALNIRPLLKYFMLTEGLRERIRFLTSEDFEINAQSGQLINPQRIVLVVRGADDVTLARLLEGSPLPLAAIYQLGVDVVIEHLPDGKGDWVTTAWRPTTEVLRDLMAAALNAAEARFGGQIPVLLMPRIARYLGCTDWFYLNALVKYIAWRELGYVGLECMRRGTPHMEFPDLHMVPGEDAFSLHMAAGTAAGIRPYLDVANPELSNENDRIGRMLFKLPVVAREKNLF